MKQYYAVIDTNVIVSALLVRHEDSATVRVMNEVTHGRIIPLYHQDMLDEYYEVLHREKFKLSEDSITKAIGSIRDNGIEVFPQPTGEVLIDMDDLVFYEVAMEKREDDAYLVTGNKRHYLAKSFIVTPTEMMAIIDGKE